MAIDEELAGRIRGVLDRFELRDGEEIGEIKMFGGLCFTLNRKMLIGVGKSRLMIRMADEDLERALEDGVAEPMDFTGKPLRNFAYIREEHYATDDQILDLIAASSRFVRASPPGKRKR